MIFTILFAAKIVINEVAPRDSPDWIEFYVNEDGDYGGYRVYEASNTLIKTFPSPFNLKKGDFVILVFNSNSPDDIQNKILYTSDSGLTATDNIISILDPSGSWIDAVGFSNRDGDMSATSGGYYNNMKQNNMWKEGPASFINGTNDAEVENSLVDWSKGSSGKSISRKLAGYDTDSVSDWIFGAQTKGLAVFYFADTPRTAPNPFIIGKDSYVKFLVNDPDALSSNFYKLRIFTISGILVNEISGSGIWDGKDFSGNYVPSGTYIYLIETSSRRLKGKLTVINPSQ